VRAGGEVGEGGEGGAADNGAFNVGIALILT
jgi:hypothetical protein